MWKRFIQWLKKAKVEPTDIELTDLGKQKKPWEYKSGEEEKAKGIKVTLPWPGDEK